MAPLPQTPASANGFYPPLPSTLQQRPPFPGTLPPSTGNTNPYGAMPPSSTPQPGQGQPSLANLPPNILALLQSQTQPQQPGSGYNMPPQQLMTAASAPLAGTQPNYNQLMAFLVSQNTLPRVDCDILIPS